MSYWNILRRTIVLLCMFAVLAGASWSVSPRYALLDKARVMEVEGPNLLKIRLLGQDRPVMIRLLGVGSPRNRDRVKGLNPEIVSYIQQHDLWKLSKNYVDTLLRGKVVEVWTRRWNQYDEKKRLLAYIVIPNGYDDSLDLNAEIIKRGLGFVTRDYVHVSFVRYRRLEEEAREKRRGMWKGLSMGRMSSLTR